IQPGVYQRLETRSKCIGPRVRPHCDPTGFVSHRNCIAHFESVLWDEPRLPRAEITIERLAKIMDRSTTNECACNVWTTNRRSAGFMHHHFHTQFEAKCAELIDDSRRANVSSSSQRLEFRVKESESSDMQGEQMNLAIAIVRAELYTWNDSQAQCFT